MKKLLRDSLPETIGGLTAGLVAWIFSTLYGLFEIDSRPVFVWGIVAITIYMILGWALIYVLRAKRVVEKLEPPQFVYRFQGSKRLAAISISILTSIAIGWIWFNFAWYNPTFKNVGGILILQIAGDTEDKSLRRELVSVLNAELNQERDLNIEVLVRDELIDEAIGIKSAHEQARKFGKEQKATLVIWGNRIGEKKFYPRITIVDERMRDFFEIERTLQVQNISELNLPPELVDQPLYLTLFVSGYVLYSRKEYDNAITRFKAALAQAESGGKELNDVRYYSTFFIGTSLSEKFRYKEAADELMNALIFATNSKDSATTLNNSAVAMQLGGNYITAEPFYRRALTINEKQLGPEHPDVAMSLNNLAGLLQARGKYAEVEPLYRRALEIHEKQLGPEHPHVAANLNNLAALLQDQGNYAAADSLFRRALAIREKQLSPKHPDVAASLNNLAELLRARGKYAEAEPLYRRALEIMEKQLGPEHPDVAASLNNLASLLLDQGRYSEAEPLYRRALAINEKQLGPEHPNVAKSLNNLALLLKRQGKYAAAEPLYRRALEIYEQQLGPEHSSVAQSLNNLAILLYAQGKYAAAEPMFRRALEIWEKQLGLEHPDTKRVLKNLEKLHKHLQ